MEPESDQSEGRGFWERMEQIVDKGVAASRELWGKAKDKAKDLSEKGILRYEIGQLERQAQSQLALLGTKVYDAFALQGRQSIAADAPEVAAAVAAISDIQRRVEEKEEAIRKLR